MLPNSIPIAASSDAIAKFSGEPPSSATPDEVWEQVDPLLNRFLGFGIKVDDISKLLRRGPLGIDGLCRWLDLCVRVKGIDERLLEGKVEHLIEAIKLWYDHFESLT